MSSLYDLRLFSVSATKVWSMNEKTKQKLLYLLIALTTLPFFFLVNKPASWTLSSENFHALALYVSASFGYIGISLLVWQFILGTRSISGLFFTDLVSKLWLHRKLGTYGVLFIFAHPILITYSYGESFFYSFLLQRSTEFEEHVTFGRFAFIGLIIIWLTSAILKSKIAYRPWKYIHYLSYPVLFASFLHVPEVGSSYAQKGIQFFWLSFVLVTIVCALLRLRHLFGYGKVTYQLKSNKVLTPEIHMLHLAPVKRPIQIRTGQYIYLQLGLLGEEHPFTVLDHDPKTGEIAVAFKKFGKFTEKLATIEADTTLLLDGPYGVFTQERLTSPEKPAVYIAGGIGITPFVKHVLDSSADTQWLFYANQTRHTAVFRDLLKNHLGEKFVDIFSREPAEATVGNRDFEVGYMRQELIEKYIKNPEAYEYFICGPAGMMHATKEALRAVGVPTPQIHLEEFGF